MDFWDNFLHEIINGKAYYILIAIAVLFLSAHLIVWKLITRKSNPSKDLTLTDPSLFFDSDRSQTVESLIQQGNKIGAIKRYRDLHGVNLKQAKEAVEEIEKKIS